MVDSNGFTLSQDNSLATHSLSGFDHTDESGVRGLNQSRQWWWAVALTIFCVIPLALMNLGVDFSSGAAAPSGNTPADEFLDVANGALHGSFTHTLLEWSAVCAAAFVGMLCLVQYKFTHELSLLVIGVALFCSGAMDAFHTLAADRLIHAVADNRDLIPFTWALCRIFNATIMLVGVGLFAFWGRRKTSVAERNILLVVATCGVFIAISYLTVHACATSISLPKTMFPDSPIKRPYDIYPLIPYLLCGLVVFPRYLRKHRSLFAYSLLISIIPQVATQLYMAFGSFQLHDSCFNIAHALKVVCYFVPMIGLLSEYIEGFQRERDTAKRLAAKASEVSILHRALALTAEADNTDDALQQCVDMICEATGWPVGHIYLLDEEGSGKLVPTNIWHLDDPGAHQEFRQVTQGMRFASGVGLPGRILKSGKAEWIANIQTDENFSRTKVCKQISVRGAFAAPIKISEKVVGVLEFFSETETLSDNVQLEWIQSFGKQVGAVLGRRQAEENVRNSEALHRGVLDTAVDAIVTIDETGIILSINTATEKLFGYLPEEVVDKNIKILMPSPYCDEHDGYLARYLKTGFKKVIGIGREVVGRRKDGATFPMDLAISEARMGARRIFTGFVRDISQRKQDEKDRLQYLQHIEEARVKTEEHAVELQLKTNELIDARFRAEQANLTKSTFLANMSHELRTPMNSIIGFTRRLLKKLGDRLEPQYVDALETVDRNAKHLLGLINDILDMSKIEAGRVELNRIRFNLVDAVRDATQQTSALTDVKPVEVVLDLPEEHVEIEADRVKIIQIVTNLISNGIKYTDCGTVTVSVTRANDDSLGRVARINVTDTGVGIKTIDIDRLFSKFMQLDDGSNRTVGGTGLGLYISHKLVKLHGGRVDVKSQYGQGSTFTVNLPMDQGVADSQRPSIEVDDEAQAEKSESNTPRPQVLCLTRHDEIQSAAQRIFDEAGFQMVSVDGPAAVERQLSESSFDLICVDGALIDSKDVHQSQQVTRDQLPDSIPVVVFSNPKGLEENPMFEDCRHIDTPLEQEELLKVVSDALNPYCVDVLLLEDDLDTVRLLEAAMSERDIRVRSACNGKVGIECLKLRRPSAIVLDLLMPEMDGFEFLKKLKANPLWSRIPVVVLTVKTLTPEEHDQLKNDCSAIITKGYGDFAQVVDFVLGALDRPQQTPLEVSP